MPTNRLIHATSPYLLQHAHNPVDWFEWSEEALSKALAEDKPILVSIGYSACHWCHVMERECFENEDIAQIMNEHFVCIKVDREERPDIDQIYMEAIQAMSINGGWPLNVFLTPDQKPFYGGTYFPPSTWSKLLIQLNQAFLKRRDEINVSANDLTQHLQSSDVSRFASNETKSAISPMVFNSMFETLLQRFDHTWGGIEKAPKFVMPSVWMFLLRHFDRTGNEKALSMVQKTLNTMATAGLYDQLAGGFARYSVDGEWFAPHFEKMLYDNAQLLSLYSEAYSITKEKRFAEIIQQTTSWLSEEMTDSKGGFYSALDADSEGIEGRFYVWTNQETQNVLGENSLSEKYYQISEGGNWEHGYNILNTTPALSALLSELKLSESEFFAQLEKERKELLKARASRIRPGLDDKILAAWNAMTIVGLCDAYKALENPSHLTMATNAMVFIESSLIKDQRLLRSYKGKPGTTEAFLEDYAYLIQAYHSLYEVTFQEVYLQQAIRWMDYVIKKFYDETEHFFFYTSSNAEKLISRKKEVLDNVIPSSNALMARNLLRLGQLLDRNDWIELSGNMVISLQNLIEREPVYMSYWGIVLLEFHYGYSEVVISGSELKQKRSELQKNFLPFVLFCGTESQSDLPLLQGRAAKLNETLLYVCRQKTCQLPVKQVVEALYQLQRK